MKSRSARKSPRWAGPADDVDAAALLSASAVVYTFEHDRRFARQATEALGSGSARNRRRAADIISLDCLQRLPRPRTDAVGAQELASKRFQLNMARVNRLVSLGQRLKQTPSDRSDELADLYRSAIVFLHASFEDMLRTTIEIRGGHTAKRTFGSIDTVVKALCELDLDPTLFGALFPEMSTLM